MDRLSPRQKRFIEVYLQSNSSIEAARQAGYAYPESQASRILASPAVAAEIARLTEDYAMGAEEVLSRLGRIARTTMSPFIGQTGHVDLLSDDAKDNMDLVKEIRAGKDGSTELVLHDSMTALIQLGKYHGLFTETNRIEGDINVTVTHVIGINGAEPPKGIEPGASYEFIIERPADAAELKGSEEL